MGPSDIVELLDRSGSFKKLGAEESEVSGVLTIKLPENCNECIIEHPKFGKIHIGGI